MLWCPCLTRYAFTLLLITLFTLAIPPIYLVGEMEYYGSAIQGIGLDKDLLRKFFESQYVVEAGLLRAATHVYPENIMIYIANDNVLAARALAVLGSPLASKVLTKLNNEYGGGWNGKIDILLGRDIPDKFYKPENEIVGEVDGYIIVYEKMNTSVIINNWYGYADLLVYRALDYLLHGLRPRAEQSFLNLTKMWDGYGFNDTAYNGEYQVYKCALFIYLYKALDAAGSRVVHGYIDIYNECIEIIRMAQDPVTGGIFTSYEEANGEIRVLKDEAHDVNVETTSIVVLALYSKYPEMIGRTTYLNTGRSGVPAFVGVYFYPWYSISQNRHWINFTDKPIIGLYDSYNETVIRWQLKLIKDAGIDFIIFSWWGPSDFTDYTIKTIIRYLREYGLEFIILIEPYINYTDPGPYDESFWEYTLNYLRDNYIELHRDLYFCLNGKPLILAFNPIGMTYNPSNDYQEYMIRIVGNDIDNARYQDWDLWPDYDKDLSGLLRIRRDGYVAIAPRFDDKHFRSNDSSRYDPYLDKEWYKKQWEYILANRGKIKVIAIYSWNEYHERSMIEPHIDATANTSPYYLYNLTKQYIEKLKKQHQRQNNQTTTKEETNTIPEIEPTPTIEPANTLRTTEPPIKIPGIIMIALIILVASITIIFILLHIQTSHNLKHQYNEVD